MTITPALLSHYLRAIGADVSIQHTIAERLERGDDPVMLSWLYFSPASIFRLGLCAAAEELWTRIQTIETCGPVPGSAAMFAIVELSDRWDRLLTLASITPAAWEAAR